MDRETPLERKALYNLLRMQWLQNQTIDVKPWQVEDFRSLPLEELFDKLQELELWLDRERFLAYAEQCDSPEDLADQLTSDRHDSEHITDEGIEESDFIYLILFELWRRLMPQKESLSIFCDELDQLITAYDNGTLADNRLLEDQIDNLVTVLDEGSDGGHDPLEVFEAVAARCANDLESFLFDYVQSLIDQERYSYADELLEEILDYILDLKWFLFLKAQLLAVEDSAQSLELVENLLRDTEDEPDVDYELALLSVLVDVGDDEKFFSLCKQIIPHLEHEGEFQELLQLSSEYFQRQDRDDESEAISTLLHKREEIDGGKAFLQTDPGLKAFGLFIK